MDNIDILEAAVMEVMETTPTINITLDNLFRTFRTAREIQKDGHGNYICGSIVFNPPPKPNEVKIFHMWSEL